VELGALLSAPHLFVLTDLYSDSIGEGHLATKQQKPCWLIEIENKCI
jgi:hypothetical protein